MKKKARPRRSIPRTRSRRGIYREPTPSSGIAPTAAQTSEHILDTASYARAGAPVPTGLIQRGSIIHDPGPVYPGWPKPEPVAEPRHLDAARKLMDKLDVWATLGAVPPRDAFDECVREIARLAAHFEAEGKKGKGDA